MFNTLYKDNSFYQGKKFLSIYNVNYLDFMPTQNDDDDNVMDFLDQFTSKENVTATPKPKLPNQKVEIKNEFVPKSEDRPIIPTTTQIKNDNFDKSKYEDVVMKDLPLSEFYAPGTKIKFRECSVKEIQRYSTLDESSIFDFKDKLNEIIEECVLFYNPDGSLGSHEQIFDGDRVWMIYLIREKTFPKGKVLTVPVKYKDIDTDEIKTTTIELKRKNFSIWRDEEIMQFFDKKSRCLVFETVLREQPIYMKPPTIGLRRCFDHYLKVKKENDEKINITFFKIAPFLKPDVGYMTWEEFEEYEHWFENELDSEEYMFLFDIINNHLKIGIRGLKKNMDTSIIWSDKVYPDRLTTLFLLPDAFRTFIRK
jgi:hypothetical protein